MWTFHSCNADTILFAQFRQFLRWDVCLPIGLLIGVVILVIWIVARLRQWRAELLEDESAPAEELTLDHYEKLVEEGLLDPHEFARIKSRMEAKENETGPKTDDAPPSNDQPPKPSFPPD
jgi:hypothetical protein